MNIETFGMAFPQLVKFGQVAQVVEEDETYNYIANAMPGTPVTKKSWQVRRVTKVSPYVTTWAEGTNATIFFANDIKNLSYS